jgi:hypothetical protein
MKSIALLIVCLVLVPRSARADDFKPDAGYISLFNGDDLTGWGYSANDKSAKDRFDGKTESSDGRYSAKDGILTVHPHASTQPSVTENGVSNWGQQIAVFSFNDVSLGPNVTLQVTGSRPIAILSHGDFLLQTALNGSGANGLPGSSGTGGAGGAGGVGSAAGSNGLVAQTGHPAPGAGPGAGPQLTELGFADGPSASFGGAAGNDFFQNSPAGSVYGDLTTHLEGGSSGGGGYRINGTAGGGGGGAVELGALGTLTVGAAITANGGTGSNGVSGSGSISGGNGSGGGILLFGPTVAINSSVSANGGGAGNTLAGGGGGGLVARRRRISAGRLKTRSTG